MTLAEARERLATLEAVLAGGTGAVASVQFGDRRVDYQAKSVTDLRVEIDRLRRDIARASGKPARTVSRFNTSWAP